MNENRHASRRWIYALLTLTCGLLALIWLPARWTGAKSNEPSAPLGAMRVAREAMVDPGSLASIAGVVSDPLHKPIAGARVCANVASYEIHGLEPAICTRTDGAGRYALPQLQARAYSVSAIASGYAVGTAARGLPVLIAAHEARTGIDIVLQPGAFNVRGTVVDATGGPVPHAVVRGERTIEPVAIMDVESDDDGRFALSFEPGQVVFTATAEGYAPAHLVGLAPATDTQLVLVPGGRLRGEVVSADDGRVMPGVEVRAVPYELPTSPQIGASQSDARGVFDIADLAPGLYMLVASGDGTHGESAKPIEVSLGLTVDHIRVAVGHAARVEGRVMTTDGQPCERGLVKLGAPDPTQPPAREKSSNAGPPPRALASVGANIGPGGSVRFRAVLPGHYYVTVYCFDNTLRDGPQVIDVATQDIGDLTWKVSKGASLRVLTVDEHDRPVPGIEFMIQVPTWSPGLQTTMVPGRSGPDGRFDVESVLSAGVYEITAPEWPELQPLRVDVRDGAHAEAKLQLPGSASIQATVRERNGAPVDGLRVVAVLLGNGEQGRTSKPAAPLGAGRYKASPLQPGKYELQVDDGLNPTVRGPSHELHAGALVETNLELDRGGQIRGRVIDEKGAAIPDVWVMATPEQTSNAGDWQIRQGLDFTNRARVLTDSKGAFVLERLARGNAATYSLRADQPSGGAALKAGVHIGETNATLVLRSVGTIAGEVIGDCDVSSASPIIVQTRSVESGQTRGQIVNDPRGGFLIKDVSPGQVVIAAFCHQGQRVAHAEVTADLSPSQDIKGVRLALESAAPAPAAPEAEFRNSAVVNN